MRYNKQPTDITTQLAMLKQRGLLKAYPNTITRQMGFPRGWENEPLWQ